MENNKHIQNKQDHITKLHICPSPNFDNYQHSTIIISSVLPPTYTFNLVIILIFCGVIILQFCIFEVQLRTLKCPYYRSIILIKGYAHITYTPIMIQNRVSKIWPISQIWLMACFLQPGN